MRTFQGAMTVILISFGAALLVASACDGLGGMQALAGAICWGVACKYIS